MIEIDWFSLFDRLLNDIVLLTFSEQVFALMIVSEHKGSLFIERQVSRERVLFDIEQV